MTKGPVRRAQLISPWGVGAMLVAKDGTSMIAGGLDHWFERESAGDNDSDIDVEAFKVQEWRLEKRLGVDHFRLPPEYRDRRREFWNPDKVNVGLTVPFLRFPQWHFCPMFTCRRLEPTTLTKRDRYKCPECQAKGRRVSMIQVPFVAICEDGHIQDFPWREWVHRTSEPECNLPLKLLSTGGASLAAQKVTCACGKSRNLAGITEAYPDRTTLLSKSLNAGEGIFFCQGRKPWIGDETGTQCDKHLRGSLRSASNVYYAQVKSAIFLPRGIGAAPSGLVELLQQPPFSTDLGMLRAVNIPPTPQLLRNQHPDLLVDFTDEQIEAALRFLGAPENGEDTEEPLTDSEYESEFRRAEFEVLREPHDEVDLLSRREDISKYDSVIANYFSSVVLLDKLRETRVLTGFTRIYAENNVDISNRIRNLWKNPPFNPAHAWLPAYIVYGEGIFLEFNEEVLRDWESDSQSLAARTARLTANTLTASQNRGVSARDISPRFLLVHTFSHLLMNQLTFECGYSSAALRERLFVSSDGETPMAGLLIYTADGDAEGTMGGLVRMGKPGNFEPVVLAALEAASWCSSDPVCMETGASGGQGPDSCNLAACHSCALVPETACEEFNRFLDRAVVIGDVTTEVPGLFSI